MNSTRTLMRLMAMMVVMGFAAQGMAQPLSETIGEKGQRDEASPLVQEKVVNETGTLLTLTSYVTGKTITTGQSEPLDVCIILDCSSSMGDEQVTLTQAGYYPYYIYSRNEVYSSTNSSSSGFDCIYSRDYSYNTATSTGSANYQGPFYYFYTDESGNSSYCQVKGLSYSSKYYLYFETGGNRYYLSGTSVVKVSGSGNPTSAVTGQSSKYKPIWKGGGLFKYYASGKKITRMAAMQGAVANFIAALKKNAAEAGVDHRVSFVKFSNYTGGYAGGSESSLEEGNTLSITFTQPSMGTSNATVNFSSSRTQVLKNFRNVSTCDTELLSAVYGIFHADNTPTDKGVIKTKYVMADTNPYNQSPYIDPSKERKKVVIVFTDGYPTVSGGDFSDAAANNAISTAKTAFKDGNKAEVYSVGFFDQNSVSSNATTREKVVKVVKYLSSTFPQATSLTSPGTEVNKTCWWICNDPKALDGIFQQIAEISVPGMQLGSTTIVQDVISDYFQLPQDVTTSDIKVYTAPCNGYNETTQKFTFGSRSAFTGANIVLTTYQGRQAIRVSNFDFSENYVAVVSGTPRGKELIIEIPIRPKYNNYGDLPTNADGSTIYPNGDMDNPLTPFPTPHYFVKNETWVEYVNTQPSGWSLDNIDSKEDLAWLISYVSGYNGQTAHPNAVAKLTADVDMGDYCWVPIGGSGVCYNKNSSGNWVTSGPSGHGFSGTFDGQGHVIKNIKNDAYTMPQAGMFGLVNGGTIQNVFVANADFHPAVGKTSADGLCTGTEGHFGIIADTICNGGVLKNSEAQGWIKTYSAVGPMNTVSGFVFPDQDPTDCYIGGLVGLVGRNKAGSKSAATVHSCVSVASLAGYSMGGVVNEIGQDSKLNNSYSYPTLYSHVLTANTDLGGLVAVNYGTVANCYLRERATNVEASQYGIKAAIQRINSADWHKGLLAGENQGTVKYCYVPSDWSSAALVDGDKKTTAFVGYGTTAPSALASFAATSTPYLYKHHDNQVTSIAASGSNNMIPASPNDRLLLTLNAWTNSADGAGTTKWFRTTANGINNDYPVLKVAGLQSVASDDQVVLFYGDVNNALSASGRTMMTTAKTDDVICLYENAAVTQGNNGTTLYINEDVAITQTQALNAYVGITLDNSAGANGANPSHPSYEFGTDGIDWHMFATSLSNAPMGINYTDVSTHPFNNHSTGDTPQYNFFAESVYDGYFPSKKYGTNENYYADWDFYCWSEPYYHYLNFKRNKNDHYFEKVDGSGAHATLNYSESDQPSSISGNANLIPGKGYMLAVATETFLQSHGTLNNGNITRAITKSESNTYCAGYNLVGNPYQSYLDFDAFANTNGINTYAIIDEDQRGYVTYTKGASSGMRYINMHQGFFVETSANKTLSFTNSMRNITATATTFRGEEQSDYPYLELTVTDANGFRDYTTIEFGRPELGGGKKMMDLRLGDAQIYAHYEDVNYSTFFATNDVTNVPVRFTTVADGSFTLSWEIANSRFGNLILVDNLNGQTIDMRSRSTYKFEGSASDYASRFKIVFALTETEEEENEELSENANFAFQIDGNIVVNGQGRLEMYDASGRLVMATDICDVQSIIALPEMAKGVYVMRLANNKSIKTQKIVIR